MHRSSLGTVGLVALLCGVPSVAAHAQESVQRMALTCASPLFDSTDEAVAGYSDANVMLRNELAYQALGSTVSSDQRAESTRRAIYEHLWACRTALSEIRRRDASIPDIAGIAKEGFDAIPALDAKRRDSEGNLSASDQKEVVEFLVTASVELGQWAWDKYQANVERDTYRKHHRAARRAALELASIAESRSATAHPMVYGIGVRVDLTNGPGLVLLEVDDESPAKAAGLRAGDTITSVDGHASDRESKQALVNAIAGAPNSAVKIGFVRGGSKHEVRVSRSKAVYEAALLGVEINGSWNGHFASDWVFFRNDSGRDLTDVTLLVTLRGSHGDAGEPAKDSHLHYVGNWPAGATKIARYMSSAAEGIATDESVDQIETLSYELCSSQYRQSNTIRYTTADYDEDVKRYWGEPTFVGQWFDKSMLLNAGFMVARKDERGFPCTAVTITAYRGTRSQRVRWNMQGLHNTFAAGGTGGILFNSDRFFSSEHFNEFHPDRVTVKFEFPHSEFSVEREWKLN